MGVCFAKQIKTYLPSTGEFVCGVVNDDNNIAVSLSNYCSKIKCLYNAFILKIFRSEIMLMTTWSQPEVANYSSV